MRERGAERESASDRRLNERALERERERETTRLAPVLGVRQEGGVRERSARRCCGKRRVDRQCGVEVDSVERFERVVRRRCGCWHRLLAAAAIR